VPPEILIVDDVPLFREMAALFLSRSGRVRTVASVDAALAAIAAQAPDVLFADHAMPDGRGVDLCRALKADPERREIAFVLLTGGTDPHERAEAIHAGADDVLDKPLSRLDLIDAVQRLAGAGRARSLPRVAIDVPVSISAGGEQHRGRVRNLSRGGLFVELARRLEGELALQFRLPESRGDCSPRAEVVWRREAVGGPAPCGAGLRFLDMEAEQVRRVADFVYERAASLHAPGSAGGVR